MFFVYNSFSVNTMHAIEVIRQNPGLSAYRLAARSAAEQNAPFN